MVASMHFQDLLTADDCNVSHTSEHLQKVNLFNLMVMFVTLVMFAVSAYLTKVSTASLRTYKLFTAMCNFLFIVLAWLLADYIQAFPQTFGGEKINPLNLIHYAIAYVATAVYAVYGFISTILAVKAVFAAAINYNETRRSQLINPRATVLPEEHLSTPHISFSVRPFGTKTNCHDETPGHYADTLETINITYVVEPSDTWLQMKTYLCFVCMYLSVLS